MAEVRAALCQHWPEYLIEAAGLGVFMVSAGVFVMLFEQPGSPLHRAIASPDLRRVLIGVAMGLTAVAIIYSPWGRQSGAHLNPAVTLTFLRLGKVAPVDAMFEEACAAFDTLDIVVANAGLQRDAPFEEMTLAQWNTVIGVNLTGQFLCARAAVREFLRRGRRPEVSRALGKIICMSSVHEVIPWAGHANYAASKGGVMMLMKTIAQELAPRGIRVNGLAPGATRTPINTEAWSTPEAYEALMRLVPYKRIAEPDDIARAAVWLASDDSDYVNGVTLFVDGGMTLYPEFASGG